MKKTLKVALESAVVFLLVFYYFFASTQFSEIAPNLPALLGVDFDLFQKAMIAMAIFNVSVLVFLQINKAFSKKNEIEKAVEIFSSLSGDKVISPDEFRKRAHTQYLKGFAFNVAPVFISVAIFSLFNHEFSSWFISAFPNLSVYCVILAVPILAANTMENAFKLAKAKKKEKAEYKITDSVKKSACMLSVACVQLILLSFILLDTTSGGHASLIAAKLIASWGVPLGSIVTFLVIISVLKKAASLKNSFISSLFGKSINIPEQLLRHIFFIAVFSGIGSSNEVLSVHAIFTAISAIVVLIWFIACLAGLAIAVKNNRKINPQTTPTLIVMDEFQEFAIKGDKNFPLGDDNFWANRKDDRL